MEKALRKVTVKVSTEAAFILLTVVSALVLPQIFHAAGMHFGIGGALGQMFLPMYLPVMILGFYRGAAVGAIAGLISPLVSFAITSMPAKAILPYIAVELIATGLLAGVFAKVKLPALLRVFLVQICAKAARLCAFAIGVSASGATLTVDGLFAGIAQSWPGVLLQLALVTYLIFVKEKKRDA